jgi:hypothetical protein
MLEPLDERAPNYAELRDAQLRACFDELERYLVPNPRKLSESDLQILAAPLEFTLK